MPALDQPERQLVHALGETVVIARDLDEIHQFAFQLSVLVAQHLDLMLDQRDRRAAGMRDFQHGQQAGVVLKKIRVVTQVIGDRSFFKWLRLGLGLLRCRHMSMRPLKTCVAGPVMYTG